MKKLLLLTLFFFGLVGVLVLGKNLINQDRGVTNTNSNNTPVTKNSVKECVAVFRDCDCGYKAYLKGEEPQGDCDRYCENRESLPRPQVEYQDGVCSIVE